MGCDVHLYNDFRPAYLVYYLHGKLKAPAPDMFAFGLNQAVRMAILELWASEIIRFVIVYELKGAHFGRKFWLKKGDMKEVVVRSIKNWDPQWVFIAIDWERVSLMTWERCMDMGLLSFYQVRIEVNENERIVLL